MVDLDDDFIVGAKKSVTVRNYEKNDQKICLSSFKKHFVDEFKIDTLLQNSVSGDLEKLYVRATLWKILLGIIPNNQNFNLWIESVNKDRNAFKSKLKALTNLKKLAGDPLGGLNESSNSGDGWNSFFKDNELKKLINLDISRTYQDKELFQNTAIKELLTNILFIWAKENPEPSYRQGMNEILALLLFAMYPFYFSFDKRSNNLASTLNSMKRDENFAKELYSFLYDEEELQADLYCLFDNLMQRGIINLYCDGNDESAKNNDKEAKKRAQKQSQMGDSEPATEGKAVSLLQRRCNRIYLEYLKCIDQELYNYLVKIDVNPTLFLVRWLKCLLSREFHHRDVIVLLDMILSNDLQEKLYDEKSSKIPFDNLNMLDYVCVSMITYIREDILRKDQVECLQRLFKYPPIESPVTLIKMALNIKSVILKKLIFKEESNNSPNIPKVNSSNQINQGNYGSNNNRTVVNSNSHPLEKAKIENSSSENTLIVSSYQTKSNESNNLKISNMSDCIKKLENLTEKYKDKVEPKDLDELNKILDYLRRNKY